MAGRQREFYTSTRKRAENGIGNGTRKFFYNVRADWNMSPTVTDFGHDRVKPLADITVTVTDYEQLLIRGNDILLN